MPADDSWYDRWIETLEQEGAFRGYEEKPGRIEVMPCEFGWYWHAYVGDDRVNGGLCEVSSQQANREARWAIASYRAREIVRERRDYLRTHYWDVETGQWVKHGEVPLPPVS